MGTSDFDAFSVRLVAETLFYDEEYGALGNLSLIDDAKAQERFIAAYSPEDEHFVIDEATEWEQFQPEGNEDIGYSLANHTSEYGTYETADEAAAALLQLARTHGLSPSITLLFEQDDMV